MGGSSRVRELVTIFVAQHDRSTRLVIALPSSPPHRLHPLRHYNRFTGVSCLFRLSKLRFDPHIRDYFSAWTISAVILRNRNHDYSRVLLAQGFQNGAPATRTYPKREMGAGPVRS